MKCLFVYLLRYSLRATVDIIDKFLLEFESFDPFLLIIIEGISSSLITFLFFLVKNPLVGFKIINDSSEPPFILFLFSLFLYYLFCILTISFRIMTNKLYSPIVINLSEYFLNPIIIVCNFFVDDDFYTKDEKDSKIKSNTFYFTLNLILSIITVIFTFIYNEFIILFCFGLERDTYEQIVERSKEEIIEMSSYQKEDLINDEFIEDEEDNKSQTYIIYV